MSRLPRIKGYCADCTFKEQELVTVEEVDGQQVNVVDELCGLADLFVPLDGFCHLWVRRTDVA